MAESITPTRILIVFEVVFGIISIALLAYLVHHTPGTDDSVQGKGEYILSPHLRFPEFFRTREEQAALVKKSNALVAKFRTGHATEGMMDLTTTYHSCCVSNQTYQTPVTAKNLDNRTVVLVQDVNGRFQHFPYDNCTTALDCSHGCQCRNLTAHFQAVVLFDFNKVDVQWIKLSGCCKCVNQG